MTLTVRASMMRCSVHNSAEGLGVPPDTPLTTVPLGHLTKTDLVADESKADFRDTYCGGAAALANVGRTRFVARSRPAAAGTVSHRKRLLRLAMDGLPHA
jgi:hypothetical protein